MPLHLCDGRSVSLKHKDGAVLLEVPDSNQAICMASNELASRSLTPLETPNTLVTLESNEWFSKALPAVSAQVEDINGAVYAASYNVAFVRIEGKTLYFTLRIDSK